MAGTETKGQLTLQLNCTDTSVRKKATAGAVKFNAAFSEVFNGSSISVQCLVSPPLEMNADLVWSQSHLQVRTCKNTYL